MPDELAFYASPAPMTRLAGIDRFETALAGLPSEPNDVAEIVRGLVMHPFWAPMYGVDIPEDHLDDIQIRSASAMVDQLLSADDRPLVEARESGQRFFGNCRHYSVLTVALLRMAGVPSRARCGFGGYFQAGLWLDHWIVEHWNGDRWVCLDAQVDEFQRDIIGLNDDPGDLSPGRFLTGGDAWLACQRGDEQGETFGILDEWGQWFIPGNIARDLAALNKVEMLPWDGWGDLASEGDAPGGDAYVDEVAALTVSGDHATIRRRYATDDGLRVPGRVLAFWTRHGPVEVDVPEAAQPPGT